MMMRRPEIREARSQGLDEQNLQSLFPVNQNQAQEKKSTSHFHSFWRGLIVLFFSSCRNTSIDGLKSSHKQHLGVCSRWPNPIPLQSPALGKCSEKMQAGHGRV